jgi:hypothetical protein
MDAGSTRAARRARMKAAASALAESSSARAMWVDGSAVRDASDW